MKLIERIHRFLNRGRIVIFYTTDGNEHSRRPLLWGENRKQLKRLPYRYRIVKVSSMSSSPSYHECQDNYWRSLRRWF